MVDNDPKGHVFVLEVDRCERDLRNVPDQVNDGFCNRPLFKDHFTVLIGRIFRERDVHAFPVRIREGNFHRPLFIYRGKSMALFSVARNVSVHCRPTYRCHVFIARFGDGIRVPNFSSLRVGLLFL